tara:strand:- start:11675 stop:16006 length:4332 start_codon:yes stop_codon:yes gene_type:complete
VTKENEVELDRRLLRLGEQDLPDGRLLDDSFFLREGGESWEQVLSNKRCVVFASGGAGKSVEFRMQATKRFADGKAAFFLTLDDIASDNVETLLSADDGVLERFTEWRDAGSHPAWFFLDSVDELKLSNKKLESALRKLKRAIRPAVERAHIVLSCRPFDWQPHTDLATFERVFPVPHAEEKLKSGDEEFLAAFEEKKHSSDDVVQDDAPQEVAVYALLHFNKDQIRAFAQAKSVKDLDGFIREVTERDAWSFVHRPIDLKGQIQVWNNTGRLGTKREQHEFALATALRDDPDRGDAQMLNAERALEGAKRLALALVMVKKRTIQSLDRTDVPAIGSEALDPVATLSDWSDAERKALLGRPLFEPASYGRVRFHNQTVESYLAAQRLLEMRSQGLSQKRLGGMLFREKYGFHVLVPSMRDIAAWLALENDWVCDRILEREPEALVGHGDPESLPLERKSALLAAFIKAYGGGGWRGFSLPRAEMNRLADPALAEEIAELWASGNLNQDCQQFLMELVWLGRMEPCKGLALQVAMDVKRDRHTRMLAIRALAGMGASAALRAISDDILVHGDRWHARIIHTNIDDLFPSVLSVTELMQLIARTPEPRRGVSGFNWNLYQITKTLPAPYKHRSEMIKVFADQIWAHRAADAYWNQPKSEYEHLSPALAQLLVSEFDDVGEIDPSLFRPIAIACRFHDSTLGRAEVHRLTSIIKRRADFRLAALIAEFELHQEFDTANSVRQHFFMSVSGGSAQMPGDEDLSGILLALTEAEDPAKRTFLLYAALRGCWNGKVETAALTQIKNAISDDASLNAIYEEETHPQEPNPALVEMEQQERQRKAEKERRRVTRNEDWLGWKANALADVEAAFGPERLEDTLRRVTIWLHEGDTRNRTAFANWRNIRRVLGSAFSDRLEAELRRVWRTTDAPVWSRLPVESRNTTTAAHMRAHTGLAIEASLDTDWAKSLSAEDAGRASGWALTELNGFPEWAEALAEAQPEIFRRCLIEEIRAELRQVPARGHLHSLSAVQYGPGSIRALIASELVELISGGVGETVEALDPEHFPLLMSVITDANVSSPELADLCEREFLSNPADSRATDWLKGLFSIDFGRGVDALFAGRDAISEAQRTVVPVAWLATVFSGEFGRAVSLDFAADSETLVRLATFAYEVVRRDDDVEHEGTYSPNTRDNAERARDRILGKIIEMPGAEAHSALMAMAELPLFGHMPDRLRILARERAAADSEPSALSETDFRVLERRYSFPPRNHDELFETLCERFEEINHDLQHADFSDRPELVNVTIESVMQRRIAASLQAVARDDYSVSREEEVADKKEPDIRVVARAYAGKAAVELKIIDGDSNWSVNQLEQAIRTQLVKQYLRHEDCRVGALVVTYGGRKNKEHPVTHKQMTFEEVIDYLKKVSADEEAKHAHKIRIAVIGLDLQSPLDSVRE